MKKIAITTAFCLLMQTVFALSACASYEDNAGTVNLTAMTVTGAGIAVNENKIEITQGGDFTVTGENENAMIYVNAQDKVKLRLSGVSLKNLSGPAIFFDNAEKALITITENTENYIEDAADYGEIDAKAAIFSNDDLEIKGNGVLTVAANFKHGIASDDDISVENGTINITANVSDGIHVNNTFKMSGGTLNITAASDGIQAEEDVVIDSGTINVLNSEEGIESGTTLTINGGEISIVSKDDGLNSGGGTDSGGGMTGFGGRGGMGGSKSDLNGDTSDFGGGRGQQGVPPEGHEDMTPPEGVQPKGERPQGTRPELPDDVQAQAPSQDAQFHSRGNMTPPDGQTDTTVQADTSVDRNLYINGGVIRIDASGDGVDSNSSIYMTGGELYVDGPTASGNGAIDANRFEVSGGTVVAVGNSGMAMGVASGSDQCAIMVNLSESIQAGSTLSLKDTDGNVLFEYTAKKTFSNVVYSSEKLKESETYTLYVNGEEKQSVEMTAKQVTIGTAGRGFGGKGGFGDNFGNKGDGLNGSASMNGPAVPNGHKNIPIKVYLNGAELTFDSAPTIQNDTTLVPIRAIFEALGMEVQWDENTQTVTAQSDGVTLMLTIGSKTASRNGKEIGLLTAPVISGEGRTLVPVRFIAESLGYDVAWDESTRTVDIHS